MSQSSLRPSTALIPWIVAATAAGVSCPTALAAAQDADAPDGLPPVSDVMADADSDPFRFSVGYEWQDDAPLAGGGRLGVQRASLDFGVDMPVSTLGIMSFDLEYDLDSYDFKRTTVFTDEWEDVHSLSLSARLDVDLNNDWTVFGGPVIRYSGEDGADFGDSLTGGGFGGLKWQPSSDLEIGLGLAVVGDLEDDVRVFPMFILNWEFTSDFSLRAAPTSFNSGASELQLVWDMSRDFELAGGYVFESKRRFRLDDSGAVLNGIGEEEGTWLYVRGTWDLATNSQFIFSVGLALEPDARLELANGNGVVERDYDPTFAFSARYSVRF